MYGSEVNGTTVWRRFVNIDFVNTDFVNTDFQP